MILTALFPVAASASILGNIFHTSDMDFNGTPSQTTVSGGSVGLAINSPTYSLTQTNDNSPYDDTTTPKPTYLTGSFKNRGNSPFTASGMSNTTTTGSGAGTSVVLTTNPSWISGYCGVQVYNADIFSPTAIYWKTDNSDCVPPQCSYTGTYPDDLVASNSVTFGTTYPARQACKDIGGRLPTTTELSCIYNAWNSSGRGTIFGGTFQSSYYWSSTEYGSMTAYRREFGGGALQGTVKNASGSNYVRCVSDTISYNSPGTYTSYVDSGNVLSQIWNTFQMTKGSTAGGAGTIAIKIKASTDKDNLPTFNATGAACDFSVSADGSSGSKDLTTCTNLGSGRYLWYQATLTTADTANSPLLQDVAVSVANNSYYSSGTYTSPIIQRAQVASWGNISWTKTGTGTITMRARSCSTSSESSCQHYGDGWSYCGTINSGDGVKMASPNCVSDSDKFIQYQATLSGDTTATPYLEDVTLGYLYNPDTTIMSGVVKFFGSITFK